MSVLLETSLGDIVVDTFYDVVPNASLNFIKLCKIKYYNDVHFFRIEKDFIAQTGDPTNSGKGGAAVFSACRPAGPAFIPRRQPKNSLKLTHALKGSVSYSTSSSNVGSSAIVSNNKLFGSQFFITLSDGLDYLDPHHSVFGTIAEGLDVVDKLAATPVDGNFCPFRVLRIRHTIILHDPFDDPVGLPIDCPSPPPAQTVPHDRLPSDDDETDDPIEDGEQDDVTDNIVSHRRNRLAHFQHQQTEREAQSRAEVLEMIGDIADSHLKPPDNVLFVCKLNPVTNTEDLQIIFSRFGECDAEIIKDRESGESLCYAFIEFQTKTQCEKAYFKMDNTLIDDRRVHVDFSQSVSKLWNQMRIAKKNQTRLQSNPRILSYPRSSAQSQPPQLRDVSAMADRAKRRKTRFDQR